MIFCPVWPSRDNCPFVALRSTDMTVGDSCAGFPVDDFCKLVLSDHDFHNITLASPTTDYKRWKNEWIDEWMSMKEMEMWVNEGTNEWTSNEQNIYILRVNIEWMSWWMPQDSRWCEWISKYNTVYSSYNAHDNTVHVYLCLFTSDRLRGIHNANNPLFTKLSLAIYHQ